MNKRHLRVWKLLVQECQDEVDRGKEDDQDRAILAIDKLLRQTILERNLRAFSKEPS